MMRKLMLAAALVAACGMAGKASAAPVFGTPGTPIIAGVNGTELKITFLGFSAGNNNELYYLTVAGVPIFEVNGNPNNDPAVNQVAYISANFLANSELVFALNVASDNPDTVLYSGDGVNGASAANPTRANDPNGYGNKYASVQVLEAGKKWNVGFEDLIGTPDDDFNDMMFQVEVVPEPASILAWSLMGGTFGIAIWRRNRKNAA